MTRHSSSAGAADTGTLWLVATPIGTLGDLAPRATEVLAAADVVCAEDTRRTGRLLAQVGVAAGGRLRSLHEHNERSRTSELLARLGAGEVVALVSDAGTPVLSDPGFELVRAARAAGVRVLSVPGPSAFTTALAAAGQPPLPATLVGFLPARSGPRRRRISELAELATTLVVLLSPHRLAAELGDLAAGLGGERPATLLAELSKRFERAQMASLAELAGGPEAAAPRGEYVLVIAPVAADQSTHPPVSALCAADVRALYELRVARGMARSEALRATARALGLRRNQVFELLSEHAEE